MLPSDESGSQLSSSKWTASVHPIWRIIACPTQVLMVVLQVLMLWLFIEVWESDAWLYASGEEPWPPLCSMVVFFSLAILPVCHAFLFVMSFLSTERRPLGAVLMLISSSIVGAAAFVWIVTANVYLSAVDCGPF